MMLCQFDLPFTSVTSKDDNGPHSIVFIDISRGSSWLFACLYVYACVYHTNGMLATISNYNSKHIRNE